MQEANNTATAGYISATGSLLGAAGGFMKPNSSNMTSSWNKQNLASASASTIPNSGYQMQNLSFRPIS
jgi:hypothetical protein